MRDLSISWLKSLLFNSSSSYITRVFIKTEMVLKSKSVCSGNKQLVRSRSTDNLPSSQSQINIQMMSHTLTIREVNSNPNNSNYFFFIISVFKFLSLLLI